MKTLVVDIEANDLLENVSKIWMIVCKDVDTGEIFQFTSKIGNLMDFNTLVHRYDKFVMHNGIGYDMPVLKKILNISIPFDKVMDTFILSQMIYPNEMQSHGLAAWGKYFQYPKGDFKDFSQYSDEMLEYCIRDVDITYKLFLKIRLELAAHDWSKAVKLEHDVYRTFCKHQKYWYLDVEKAKFYIRQLSRLIDVCTTGIIKLAPKVPSHSGTTIKPKLSNGTDSSKLIKLHSEGKIDMTEVVGDFCLIEFNTINLNSTQQVINWLLSLGWIPDEYNFKKDKYGKPIKVQGELVKTSPSISNSEFNGVPDHIRKYLTKRNKARHRRSTIEGWVNAVFDGNKIPTFALTCGTNTGRWRHSLVVNVPKAGEGVFFGDQMRSLFIAPSDLVLAGFDFSQLEARIEGHATFPYDGGIYAKFLLEEDVHSFNAKSWGISRTEAKSPGYALSYQCGPGKIKSLLNCSDDRAQNIWTKYREDRPGMMSLIEDLENSCLSRGFAIKTGSGVKLKDGRNWIRGIDGRKLYVRSAHSLKNTYIQNAGMLAVKITYVQLDKLMQQYGIVGRIVMVYHDECQILIDPKTDIKLLEKAIDEAIKFAEKTLELKVPLAFALKTGKNWRDTH